MSGLKLTIPTVFSDNTLPIYYPDSRMNKGTIALLDFSHPNVVSLSVPANGATVNNIAWENAARIISGASQSTLAFPVQNTIASGQGFMEITAKKGLHGIISQVNDVQAGNDFIIQYPAAIFNYIRANISRGFYISIWDRLTRLTIGSVLTADSVLALFNTSNYIYSFQATSNLGGNLGGTAISTPNTTSNRRRSIGTSLWNGTPASTQLATNSFLYKFGSAGAYATFEVNKCSSNILYSVHIIDLTSAGLTYAQAEAADIAAYNAAFSNRFANDTFTDPTILV